jgi:hypothetical protein
LIYINLLLENGIASDLFTFEQREFPVDFISPFITMVINMIEIPEGYEVAELPANAVSLPDDSVFTGRLLNARARITLYQ